MCIRDSFKIFYPAAYYCCYLHRNAESFDASRMTTENVDELREMIEAIKALDKSELTATKEDEAVYKRQLLWRGKIHFNVSGHRNRRAHPARSAL